MKGPCIEIYKKPVKTSLSAIVLSNSKWRPGDIGNISISFGNFESESVSTTSAWSHIGKNSNNSYPSMNLGFIDPPIKYFTYNNKVYYPEPGSTRNYYTNDEEWIPGSTVIHEFCHALGMLHEHQNNLYDKPIKLNVSEVIKYYKSLGLSEDEAYNNVIELYEDNTIYEGTDFDKDSIMLYYLPDEWVDGENPTKPNFRLSEKDISILQKMYPLNAKKYPVLKIEFVDDDSPEWKRAWVEKMVIETFCPIIGIKFLFPPLEEDKKKDDKESKKDYKIYFSNRILILSSLFLAVGFFIKKNIQN